MTNREAWLLSAVESLRPLFVEAGEELPEKVRVSVGWPGGRGKKSNTIGQCWHKESAEDEVCQIFISPVVKDSADVLAILAHELIHALCGSGVGHRGKFVTVAKDIGLVKPWTATTAGEELAGRLTEIVEELGEFPHAALTGMPPGGKTQTTRMIKAECPAGSGYKVRLTKKWLDEYGAPYCPCCTDQMEVEEKP